MSQKLDAAFLEPLYVFVVFVIFALAIIAGLKTTRIDHPTVSTPAAPGTSSSTSGPTPGPVPPDEAN
jgi:hypothetical protein